jgi:hypothetical protein
VFLGKFDCQKFLCHKTMDSRPVVFLFLPPVGAEWKTPWCLSKECVNQLLSLKDSSLKGSCDERSLTRDGFTRGDEHRQLLHWIEGQKCENQSLWWC